MSTKESWRNMELNGRIASFILIILQCLTFNCLVSSFTLLNKDNSFLKYEQWNAMENGTLRFRFKVKNRYGLLMYSDNSQTSSHLQNFISLIMHNGQLKVTVQMGSEDYKSRKDIYIGRSLNDLKWHTVEIKRNSKHPRLTWIQLDDIKKTIVNDGEYDTLELNSGLYFGGISKTVWRQVIQGTIRIQPR